MNNLPLITKYRPTTLDDVVGHDHVVRSLRQQLKANSSHAFIFHGPSGTGKTTVGRIVASSVGCVGNGLLEIDAATHTGVDDIRGITKDVVYANLNSPSRVVLLDECHMLSKSAFGALLKALEDPPPHVYWVLCTTDIARVPKNILTRCSVYELDDVAKEDILTLLQSVVEQEELTTSPKVLAFIASKADGSPRQALSWLDQCRTTKKVLTAKKLLSQSTDGEVSDAAIQLCRGLISGRMSYPQAIDTLGSTITTNAQGIRFTVLSYFNKIATNPTSNERSLTTALNVLDVMSPEMPDKPPASTSDLLVRLGELLLN